jgi:hypothetical protein
VVQQAEQTLAPVARSVEPVLESVAPLVQQTEQTLAPVAQTVAPAVEGVTLAIDQAQQNLAPVGQAATGLIDDVTTLSQPLVAGTTTHLGLEEPAQQYAVPLTGALTETVTPLTQILGLPPPGLSHEGQAALSPLLASVAGLPGGVVPSDPSGVPHQQVVPALPSMPGLAVAGINAAIVEPPAFQTEAAASDGAGTPSLALAGPAGSPVNRASGDPRAATLAAPDSLLQADRARTSQSPAGVVIAWLNSALLSAGSSAAGPGLALAAILMASFLVANPPAFAARASLVLIQPPSRSLKPVYPPN